MLQCLNDWRAECSAEQLAAFDALLAKQCGTAISKTTINNRYAGSFHKALISRKVLNAASTTEPFALRPSSLTAHVDAGVALTHNIAKHQGWFNADKSNEQENTAAAILLQRGVIFERDEHYCLAAECVVELRSDSAVNDWPTLACNTPKAMLHQLVPAQAQATMLQPNASHNEMVAWLMVHGLQARETNIIDQLDASDWSLLLLLQQCDLGDFDALQGRYPELPSIQVTQYYYYNDKEVFSPRKALEQRMPAQLIKLYRLGLIGIKTFSGDNTTADITLCLEAQKILKPYWEKERQRIVNQLKEQWQAEPCDTEYPSAWSMDQDLWRLWIILHFLPPGITQQKKLRKLDIKKIAALMHNDNPAYIEFMLFGLLTSELIMQQGTQLVPCAINWKTWQKNMRAVICQQMRSWDAWDDQDEDQAFKLLATLPTTCWLKLDEVIEWLRTQSSGSVINADWMALFTGQHSAALHHLNLTQRSIYLLPEFRLLVQKKAVSFPAPGWHGANKKAKVHGFISAAGEIQLPPDCNHKILQQLAGCCGISAIEQMITLQLDEKAIQRMGTDKSALKKTKALLESLLSPLPQAVAYLFDKQQSQTAVAQIAATSMLIMLNDVAAIHKLHQTGFEFSQPFKDKPELVLLDASADAFAFVQACNDAGILLDSLIQAKQWISGTASIHAWMNINQDREGQWLEISYQKTRSSKPKQTIARIDADYYGSIRIQATRKTKQGYSLLKSTVQLQAKHVLRMRELDADEANDLGLDRL
ncbi:MAG: hypothetical protein Q9M16_07315 [Mariprofundus sp.]|nr:hypothetical protein [Mariprofundus sp.]